ncbi:MAG TPA: histidine kinase dimerization/phospho-acceptor domain-containing protein, partial [Segetibacter sp.]
MPSATLRWIILITTITLGLLVSVQLFWLNKIHNYEQKEFSTSVVKSIQGVYEDLDITNSSTIQLRKLIEQPDPNTFLFKIDSLPQKQILVDDVLSNLEDFQVFTDCVLSVYDPLTHKYLYELYLPAPGSFRTSTGSETNASYRKTYGYVRLYFPHRNQYILSSMTWWIVSAAFLLLVLLALGLSIFYLYRQKFLNEIQNDFIRNVTHEFQTPLTTLTVGLDGLSKPFIAGNQHKFELYVKLMQAQTAYLKHHIENLMKVLKAEANGLVLDKTKVSPHVLIKKALAQLQPVSDEKQAIIKLVCEETNASITA